MTSLRNKVQLIGNLGADPEIKTTGNGKKVAVCRMATTETYRNGAGERVKDTQWHRIVAWGRNAELLEKYVVKGSEIAVEGKITHRDYETSQGEKRWITEVIVSHVLLMRNTNHSPAA